MGAMRSTLLPFRVDAFSEGASCAGELTEIYKS